MRRRFRWPLLAALSLVAAAAGAAGVPADVGQRTRALNALIAQQWEYTLRQSPETATVFGDYRYNDRWTDYSLAAIAARRRHDERVLKQLELIDPDGMADGDRLNRRVMIADLTDSIAASELRLYEMPVDQINGIQIMLPGLVATTPFDTLRQYDDYVRRLSTLPRLLDQVTALLRKGRADRMMPPRTLLEQSAAQCEAIAQAPGAQSAFGEPLARMPETLAAAERARLTKRILRAIDGQVRPAYARLARFIRTQYAPYGRETPGVWALPGGERIYAYYVRHHTTTDLTPRQIHDIGLAEVARIESEMGLIATRLGFTDLAALRKSVDTDPARHATSAAQILDGYRDHIAAMQARLPELFGQLPSTPLEVQAVQAYRENAAAGAEYEQGTPDGSRPAIVYVNTGDYAQTETMTIETTAYHEGVPGHHTQTSVALALPDVPAFRRNGAHTAYDEGWALYAERLGKEVGFFQDPYSDYGRLLSELLRADRLVLDTGVHYLHWSREQMVQFFHDHPAGDERSMQIETDRYIVDPGQSLAYKIGQLKFLELRERAQAALGARFDIRTFHHQVLDGGSLPLDLLETRFNDWLARQRPDGA